MEPKLIETEDLEKNTSNSMGTEKIREETERIKAEAERVKAEAERLRAETERIRSGELEASDEVEVEELVEQEPQTEKQVEYAEPEETHQEVSEVVEEKPEEVVWWEAEKAKPKEESSKAGVPVRRHVVKHHKRKKTRRNAEKAVEIQAEVNEQKVLEFPSVELQLEERHEEEKKSLLGSIFGKRKKEEAQAKVAAPSRKDMEELKKMVDTVRAEKVLTDLNIEKILQSLGELRSLVSEVADNVKSAEDEKKVVLVEEPSSLEKLKIEMPGGEEKEVVVETEDTEELKSELTKARIEAAKAGLIEAQLEKARAEAELAEAKRLKAEAELAKLKRSKINAGKV